MSGSTPTKPTDTARTERSERKRLSIPRADESVHEWWEKQLDPALSIRMLIRAEIERNGYTDTAYRPVAQLPKRGRPRIEDIDDDDTDREPQQAAPASAPAAPERAPEPAPAPTPTAAPAPADALDALMNG